MSAARTIQLLLVLLGAVATGSAAAAAPESAKPAAAKRADPSSARATQTEPAAKPPPPRRRSVQQIIGSVPSPSATQTYGPTLSPPASSFRSPAAVAPAPPTGPAQVAPAPPAQLNRCTGNFCTDAAGNSYNSGTGNAAVNSQGRLCNRVGTTMQCF
jgi:hypothetical protein